MMLKKNLTLLAIFIFVVSYSQNKLKTNFEYEVTYKLTSALDSMDLENKHSEYMTLLISKDMSSFSSRAKMMKNRYVIRGNSGHTNREAVTKYPYILIKNRREDSLYYTMKIVDDFFYYKEDAKIFDWKIEAETKKISDYSVQKATTSFSGRQYTAWFTMDIPISDGPYKFNGLPGLILEISDNKKHHVFEFVGFKKLEPKESFKINLNQYIDTTKEKLLEVYRTYRLDPFTYVNNPNVKITKEVHNNYLKSFKELLEKENNRIEKY